MTIHKIVSHLDTTRSAREELYKVFHRMPELSLQEFRTAEKIREELERIGVNEVNQVGRTGLTAVLRNGDGPVVAMRADIDGLPMAELSGKEYSAEGVTQVDENTGVETPVAHSCGHDVHIISLLGALEALNATRDSWSGTFVGVFQPAEETAAGARDMVDNGIATKMPIPDVYLGQHVLGVIPGGSVGTRRGALFSQAASIRITIYGKGSHGAMPNLGVDPTVLGAAIITRLQTIVSREIAPKEIAVVTVGSFHSGTKSNIIPDSATMLLNTRAYNAEVSASLHEAIERIVRAECEAARSPQEPDFEYFDVYPLTLNDDDVTDTVAAAFDGYFGDDSVEMDLVPASEDFSVIPDALGVPYTFWGLGGFADHTSAPGNHSPFFAPDIQPTLDRGAEAIIVAASPWLMKEN
ncbi:amidohydrolase [Corynebacterium hylobatis]|uniref:Amidohydrolase n=1 Tax=Corynebacterium hylobatis TaxID=1859290 RepID=A0A3S0C2M6_9CORY|nr:amidohydrolase [Corynebacterium hylobatis]RSZ65167.1 amidohydrolase [Corynebacterium hylobatis]